MSHSQKSPGDGTLNPPVANGQLATPSLSPISEHGNGFQSFPDIKRDIDSTVVEVDEKDESKTSADEDTRLRRRSSETRALKLSPQQIHDLTTSPDSLPVRAVEDLSPLHEDIDPFEEWHEAPATSSNSLGPHSLRQAASTSPLHGLPSVASTPAGAPRPGSTARSMSTPLIQRRASSSKTSKTKPQLPQLKTDEAAASRSNGTMRPSPGHGRDPSPMPAILPVPPLSLPTHLRLELSSDRPSALYIHRSAASDFPYESSKVKFERLLNFIRLPPQLEHVLIFGAIACLDTWLYTFTILPLRFLNAVAILAQWIGRNATQEAHDLGTFVYNGLGRLWQRQRHGSISTAEPPSLPPSVPSSRRTSLSESEPSRKTTLDASTKSNGHAVPPSPIRPRRKHSSGFRHRRTRSTPSALLPNHKADLLQGLLIIASCTVLMWFDASRMYHSIRGQAAIKLYVIYNVLEVFDRLFSAIGQDVLECLFSKETLERDADGRSKVLRPLWMFGLALLYNVIHATALFYQVVTLNVAVNSYSNALLTLLMSNQFVEIKGTVFKKFEKENLFQLTCADVVERFQLWLMLSIIALRNIVEVGGLSMSFSGGDNTPIDSFINATSSSMPLVSGYVIPQAFTLLPKWTGEVLGPFLIVLGSEALVDWCKHAYITKFNNVKPDIYTRFLDVLAKDYYTHAFADQNLTKRLGLPVIPLSCLFIRACMQTYHMFLATHMPLPIPSPATSIIDTETSSSSPATTAALAHIDTLFRRALGRSSFTNPSNPNGQWWSWSLDDIIAFLTTTSIFLAVYLLLLAFKLLLGMGLLSWARSRYVGMKARENMDTVVQGGERVGGWGTVEVGEEKRRWIYEDDRDGLEKLREKEREKDKGKGGGGGKLEGVERYSMVAKRIW
ncbi:hypothetical protein M409DRAFT_18623 [Zasmidium cellare ATCC 36951]|uniref:DUF747-domain-containing protein n=1 Tax=Zasmidium cellare ATCC 36951 TaxID=1080233 RepID=A0A6A6CZ89_ZASCE|nr:uncharacterized protein M409DRAFT_18623 [Zasmidium cellare ATCC 36951]KAF2171510.1 hypothetical protein M409DRAFT_18623 [Zasmidium cellare ATCC 36951]